VRSWHRALADGDLWEGELTALGVGGREVMLVRLPGGELRAYQARCPHQGAALAEGAFDGRYLECSAHCWRFDLATGRGVNPSSCSLVCFPVDVRDEQIFVEVEET
jgi:toluene monooxygenase system ferredoxin subunit